MSNYTFNILGVCVLRDIFSTHSNDGGYKIKKYANFFAPLYLFEKGIDLDFAKFSSITPSTKICNFDRRCIYLDITKNAHNFIKSDLSDYLLVDIALTRTDYIVLNNNEYCYGGFKSFFELLADNSVIPKIKEIKRFDFMELCEVEKRIFQYCELIKSIYSLNKIILFEVRNSLSYYNFNTKTYSIYQNIDLYIKQNKFLDICFNFMKNFLKGCHIVKFPKNVLGDANHKLGLAPMHFTKSYYDYGLKCIKIICKNLSIKDEEYNLNKLYDEYNNKYALCYYSIVQNQLILHEKKNRNLIALNERYQKYIDFFIKLYIKNINISKFFRKFTRKRIIYYGYNKITMFLLDVININPVAIIEDFDILPQELSNYSVYRRNSEYPVCDFIIINDLTNEEKIYNRLIACKYNAIKISSIFN